MNTVDDVPKPQFEFPPLLKSAPGFVFLSMLLFVLGAFVSSYSLLFSTTVYAKNGPLFGLQAWSVDLTNLVLVLPGLVTAMFFANRGSVASLSIWAGIVAYLLYVYGYNSITVGFGWLYLFYVALMGLSFYALLSLMVRLINIRVRPNRGLMEVGRGPAWLLFGLSSVFFIVWTCEMLVSSLSGTMPESDAVLGLTSPIFQTMDIGLFFPGMIISSIHSLRGKILGPFLVQSSLTFLAIMSLSLTVMSVITVLKDVQTDVPMTFVFFLTFIVSLVGILFCRRQENSR